MRQPRILHKKHRPQSLASKPGFLGEKESKKRGRPSFQATAKHPKSLEVRKTSPLKSSQEAILEVYTEMYN